MKISQVSELPEDLESLAEIARAEGHRHLDRLISEFHSGKNCFQKKGEALFIARDDNDNLIAIGGLNIEPYHHSNTIGRLRRLYVHPCNRRLGLGALLTHAIESHASKYFSSIQLYTTSAEASGFYTFLGYDSVNDQVKVSHSKALAHEEST